MNFAERKRVFSSGSQIATALRELAAKLESLPTEMTFDQGTVGYYDHGELRVTFEQASFTQDGYPQPPALRVSLKAVIPVPGVAR